MSRDLTASVSTALGQPDTAPRWLVEFAFDSGTLRLWNGLGDLEAMGETWTGAGRLGEVGTIKETQEVVASGVELRLTIIPTEDQPDAVDAFLNIALAETYQGRPVTIWQAQMDPSTGQLIDEPFTRFRGRLDVMEDSELPGAAVLKITAENRLVDLERARKSTYTPEDQRARYPGDSFFDGVAALQNREIVLK